MPQWFLVCVLVLLALFVANAIFKSRSLWFSARTEEFISLLPLLDRLADLDRSVGNEEIDMRPLAEHFDALVHVFFSSAFADGHPRRLLERRLRLTLDRLSKKGVDVSVLFSSPEFDRSQLFLRTYPSYR